MRYSPPRSTAKPNAPAATLSRSELHSRVWTQPLAVVASDLGLSRSGLAKICDRLLIPVPGRGYWTAERRATLPKPAPLAPGPAGVEALVVLSPGRSTARRQRTRLSPELRRDQLLEAASAIVAKEGVHAATLKRLAREIGISEAQAHNHFSRRTDLLVGLARRELDAMNTARESEIERGADNLARVTLSTVTYLRQVQQRGVLIQRLLNLPEVRAGLRPEREERAAAGLQRMKERLSARYGLPENLAYGATAVLTAVCLRAGRMLAEGKITLDMAEQLSLAIVTAGNRALVQDARAATIMAPTG